MEIVRSWKRGHCDSRPSGIAVRLNVRVIKGVKPSLTPGFLAKAIRRTGTTC
jgi:hypothetical protein